MVGAGRYRMAITKVGRLGALCVGCSNSMVSYITNHSFFCFFFCSLLVEKDSPKNMSGVFIWAMGGSSITGWYSGSALFLLSISIVYYMSRNKED